MQPRNPDFEAAARALCANAPFVQDLGLQVVEVGVGRASTRLPVLPRLLQQDGVVHAGVQATLADHTAGAAAMTLLPAGQTVLSINFQVNLLSPAQGDELRCRAEVVRAGRRVVVVEASVHALGGAQSRLVSRSTVTLAVVERR